MKHKEFLEAVDEQLLETHEYRTHAEQVGSLAVVIAQYDPEEGQEQVNKDRLRRPYAVLSFRTSILTPPYRAMPGEPFREFYKGSKAAEDRFNALLVELG